METRVVRKGITMEKSDSAGLLHEAGKSNMVRVGIPYWEKRASLKTVYANV